METPKKAEELRFEDITRCFEDAKKPFCKVHKLEYYFRILSIEVDIIVRMICWSQ